MIRTLVFALSIAFAAAVHAQVYKCVGADGKVVYAQTPCPAGTKAQTVQQIVPPATPGAATAAKSLADQEAAFEKRRKEEQAAEKKEQQKLAEEKQREENCRLARQSLMQFTVGGRIARYNENGERYFLNDQQIAEERAKAQRSVSEWCGQ